jgi:hypothetical protein
MGSEPTGFNMVATPESEKASMWAPQAKALHEAAWKMTYFVTLPHLTTRAGQILRGPHGRRRTPKKGRL